MNKLFDGKKAHFKPVWCGKMYVCTTLILSRLYFKTIDTLQWHFNTYAAFCRNYGTHQTEAVGDHCWNAELLERMQRAWERPWLSFEFWVFAQRAHLVDVVKAAFEENFEHLNGTALLSSPGFFYLQSITLSLTSFTDNVHLAPIALGNFIDNMGVREACIADSINQSFYDLIEALR